MIEVERFNSQTSSHMNPFYQELETAKKLIGLINDDLNRAEDYLNRKYVPSAVDKVLFSQLSLNKVPSR